MKNKVLNIVWMVIGALVGYALFYALRYSLRNVELMPGRVGMSSSEQIICGISFVIMSFLIFYRIAPSISSGTNRLANRIEKKIKGDSALYFFGGSVGLVLGLLIAYLISTIYKPFIEADIIYSIITIILYTFIGTIGLLVGKKMFSEFFGDYFKVNKEVFQKSLNVINEYEYNPKDKRNKDRVPKIFDTSVIIDGRVLEILRTGFLEGPIIIPEFVLVELRHISDSADDLKRAKGRRGLDILKKIQDEFGIEIYNTDSEKVLNEIPEVDVKLLKLAQILKGKVVTNDFNLNKVAKVKNIGVLNINELANAIKTIVIPGEELMVNLIKEGKDRSQAIGYLEDGTMIVVESALKYIGKTIKITVTSVIQTQAGRMIFGKVK